MRKRASRLIFFLGLAAGSVMSQSPATSPALSADLVRYYFSSPADEVAARGELNAELEHLRQFNGKLNTAGQLLGALQSNDRIQELYARHEGYLHLRCSLNRKDAACEDDQKLESEVEAKTAFLNLEILAISEDRLSQYLKDEPALGPYRFELADIRRDADHLLPMAEQRLLDELQPQIVDWQYDLYQQIVASISFGTVQAKTGPLDVVRQRNLIASDADGKIREEGFKRRYSGFASKKELIAFALIHTVQAQNAVAKLHHYADAPARKYHSLYQTPENTRALLELMAKHGDVVKRYEKIRSSEIERNYHQPAQAWDLAAPARGFSLPLTSLTEARGVFHGAFAGLGAEYQSAFDALLDPANGRADILPGGGPSRYGGGFSIGFTGSTSILFFGRYDGTFKDLSVIAHEGGHATHRQLMNERGVMPSYAYGPNFLFESFAAFNELVLADYMASHAEQPELKRYYRERWMDIKGLDAFYGAQDALLEQAIYDGVSAGTVRNADDLDALTVKIDSQFSQFTLSTPELRTRWATVGLMYEDPLYDVNYVYGGLLALKYYHLYSTRREWFVPRYVKLMKNGFDAPPAELLKRFLEIDLSAPSLLDADLAVLNSRMDQLEASTPGK